MKRIVDIVAIAFIASLPVIAIAAVAEISINQLAEGAVTLVGGLAFLAKALGQ